MRSLFVGLVLAFATAVSAVSTTGNRLLVVLDDVAEKTAYTSFFGDLSGTSGSI
jgi:oligosaccharyltransferase complex subunit beta